MDEQLYIPPMVKIGFCRRDDTYTKMLAYVIYFDDKGKLRKEKSWNSWRDHKIQPIEYENVPTEGFVLNKDVGGGRRSYSIWHGRMEKVRVFDPRGFEFEITTENLLFILQEATSTKGKGLEGTFVYAWSGKDLVLIPCECNEYRESKKYTDGLKGKVSCKELLPGYMYVTKKQVEVIYLGKFNFADSPDYLYQLTVENGHVFALKDGQGFELLTPQQLSAKITDSPVDNYAELMDAYNSSGHTLSAASAKIKKAEINRDDYYSRYYPERKIGGTFFKKIDDKTYQGHQLVAINKSDKIVRTDPYGYNRYGDYKFAGIKVIPLGTVTLDGTIAVNNTAIKPNAKLYSDAEIEDMNFKEIEVSFSKGKVVRLRMA